MEIDFYTNQVLAFTKDYCDVLACHCQCKSMKLLLNGAEGLPCLQQIYSPSGDCTMICMHRTYRIQTNSPKIE